MYTRCPACHTVHPVNAELLARGSGKFRCGKCRKVTNALEALFDQWPDASQQGAAAGDLPELGMSLSPNTTDGSLPNPDGTSSGDDQADEPASHESPGSAWLRVVWIATGLVLMLVVGLYLAVYFRLPVLDSPLLQPVLVTLGVRQARVAATGNNTEKIELLARTLKPHPARPGVLLLTATIVSRADRRQPYPDVDVTLVDIRGRRLSRELFKPGDYLTSSSELRSGIAPGAHFSFSLEIEDPGNEATGFELQFR